VAKEGVEQVEGWEDHDQDRDHKYADLSHFTVLQSDGMSESTANRSTTQRSRQIPVTTMLRGSRLVVASSLALGRTSARGHGNRGSALPSPIRGRAR
jgi:hypothetical protein